MTTAATPTAWTAAHVAGIRLQPLPAAPVIAATDVVAIAPGLHLWDFWPVEDEAGRATAWWMALSAPVADDADLRHARARIRLLRLEGGLWSDLGQLFPDDLSPGSRDWSGSATLAGDRLTVRFTATGRAGETVQTFEQRLFETSTRVEAGRIATHGWSPPREMVAADGVVYQKVTGSDGGIGTIKAFRDPAWVRDPRTGDEYLLFTASLAASSSAYNGAIGIARKDGGTWTLLDPLVTADALNNELERPHIRVWNGRYHLFWSTQAHVFAADGPSGPTGLYGMVADALLGPYRPLNRTGLVLCNPPQAPAQAYSWLVLDDGRVASFVDMPAACGADPQDRTGSFGGTIAPFLSIAIDHDASSARVGRLRWS